MPVGSSFVVTNGKQVLQQKASPPPRLGCGSELGVVCDVALLKCTGTFQPNTGSTQMPKLQ